MLFSTEQKNVMTGALTAGGLQALFDGYFGYRLAGGTNIANTPTDPAYWLYANVSYWLPNLSQAIAWFGVPYLFYYLGNKKRKAKLRTIGVGGMIYGVAEYVGSLAFRASAMASGQTAKWVGVSTQ